MQFWINNLLSCMDFNFSDLSQIETKQLVELLQFEFQKATLFMCGDSLFYNCMTFTEALGLDKSSECITEPLHGVRGTQRKFSPKFIENSF